MGTGSAQAAWPHTFTAETIQGAPERHLLAAVRHGNAPARTSPVPQSKPLCSRGSGHQRIIKKATLRPCALLKKGITVMGITNVPDATGNYANGSRGYELSNNGTFMIRGLFEVIAMAA